MFEGPLAELIEALQRLPGVGPKSAQRIAFYLLKSPPSAAEGLAEAILNARRRMGFCRVCFNLAEGEVCRICQDPRRDPRTLCVVEEPKDTLVLEKAGFKGRYHVLGGVISPMDGIGPEDLRIKELLARVEGGEVEEVILATNPNLEGEATALYLARVIRPLGVKVTRLASGLPVGADLEYADELTLGRALEGRREL